MILSGLLSVLAGVLLIVLPGISLLALTLVLGIWLVLFGEMLALEAFHVRSATLPLRPGAVKPS